MLPSAARGDAPYGRWREDDPEDAVIQDEVVNAAMHDFAKKVRQVKSGEMNPKELGNHSYELGRFCFESLRSSWNKPFSASEDRKR